MSVQEMLTLVNNMIKIRIVEGCKFFKKSFTAPSNNFFTDLQFIVKEPYDQGHNFYLKAAVK